MQSKAKMKKVTPSAERSRIMRAVRSRDTKPEMIVRRFLHRNGYRFRLHRDDLPGRPDLVLSASRAVVFVHGCFWHGHFCKRGDREPHTNRAYWVAKLTRNKERDAANARRLRQMGWRVLVIWECQTRDGEQLDRLLRNIATP